ncbi:DUF2255 family protein [Carboxylicivirga mesophila]|uniref:DUF2255 family protein n=1 Tax=Carboxylicivirga mesophila TaxID=1166478 RepID=A0ABS5KFI2_9BACT|nr:DUF2255 family protein [Carboxylicivirga mesophila]MBS2213657.1 DUF2255 family protein [Carboxylicivirga mesophila]
MNNSRHFPIDFYEYLEANTLIEIKGGNTRETFLKIWMVQVDNRVFARSWNKSPKSWFTEILKTGLGQIKYNNQVINIHGKKVDKDDAINLHIDKAYLDKYNQAHNLKYTKGITQPEYANYTMEFLFDKEG